MNITDLNSNLMNNCPTSILLFDVSMVANEFSTTPSQVLVQMEICARPEKS